MSFNFSNIKQPTPAQIKSVADAILWGMGSAGGLTIAFTPYPKVGALLAILGTLAKCVSNFYATDKGQS